jgi:hypothetical protein
MITRRERRSKASIAPSCEVASATRDRGFRKRKAATRAGLLSKVHAILGSSWHLLVDPVLGGTGMMSSWAILYRDRIPPGNTPGYPRELDTPSAQERWFSTITSKIQIMDSIDF